MFPPKVHTQGSPWKEVLQMGGGHQRVQMGLPVSQVGCPSYSELRGAHPQDGIGVGL